MIVSFEICKVMFDAYQISHVVSLVALPPDEVLTWALVPERGRDLVHIVHIVECFVSLLETVLPRAVRPRPLWRRGREMEGEEESVYKV